MFIIPVCMGGDDISKYLFSGSLAPSCLSIPTLDGTKQDWHDLTGTGFDGKNSMLLQYIF